MKQITQSVLFAIGYSLTALLICVAVGASFKGCQSEPVLVESPAAEAVEIVQYDPCKDPLLYLERGLESRQRQKQCGVK